MTEVSLTVRFTISLVDQSDSNGGPLVFNRWLPLGEDQGIRFQHGICSGVLWFDSQCAKWASDVTEEEIGRTVNLMAYRIHADITLSVEADLADYMKRRDFTRMPSLDEADLADRCDKHGREVFSALDKGLNRFLSFVRIEKGQYWLRHLKIDWDNMASHAVSFHAKARVFDGVWFRWQPTQLGRLAVASLPDNNDPRLIRAVDWQLVQEFVANDKKPTLTMQLLAGAESLADEGSERAALTEAVSALEVALAKFARSSEIESTIPAAIRGRLGVESLPKLVERLGLSASVSVLLPFLLSEELLPGDLLRTCREAISERQNVVHGGQRHVNPSQVQKYLWGLRQLCEVLESTHIN